MNFLILLLYSPEGYINMQEFRILFIILNTSPEYIVAGPKANHKILIRILSPIEVRKEF